MVVYPKYETNFRGEPNKLKEKSPPDGPFLSLGHETNNPDTAPRHYRLVIDRPLEETPFMSSFLFSPEPVFRGRKIPADQSWLASLLFKEETYREVGAFKGEVRLIEETCIVDLMNLNMEKELRRLQLPASIADWEVNARDTKVLVEVAAPHQKKIIVRVYVVDAEVFEDADVGSEPDPYVRLQLGDKTLSVATGDPGPAELPQRHKHSEVLQDVRVACAEPESNTCSPAPRSSKCSSSTSTTSRETTSWAKRRSTWSRGTTTRSGTRTSTSP